ncbi:trichohyalin isoform X2 [Drosophila albomicans]|uniref:Trichohyalin isoform X2 n=1 Tax=Drosophila albomicans TaxID=7291 RepID=A0A6P8WA06_DROAB|nr:trichohyalin isoform X2 [Drosophila albomicans]
MEPRAWKKLLLKWVNECHFIENITSLEESDIEAFYAIYEQYANFEPGQNSSCLEPLQIFLKDIYADFTPIFDGEGRVATTDYVYVYTLLMHYTCVQKPNKYFHNICKNLPETVQQCIAEFFKQTVDGLQLTRDCLQQTIVNIQIQNDIDEDSFLVPLVPQSSTPDRLTMHRNGNCSSSITSITPLPRDVTNCLSISLADSSNNKDSSSIVSATMENSSALLLQRERRSTMNEIQMCAPATPKTELLDQRTRELFGLRAQLETERYEKTVLEEQVLETESLIKKLTRENAEQKKQLLMLKATLANDNEDEHNYATNEFDNMKRRLMNELSKKEKILSEKSEQLQELRAEHDKLVGKFKVSEKQVLVCMDRINELEQRLNSSEQLLSERGDEMEHLAHDKLELERCLQEARNELQNGREVLNASSDLLDTSQLQSSMNTTPENLASSVIDKQLREKELENDQLRSVLELNSQEKERIESQLLQLIFKYKLEKSKESTPEKTAEKSQSHMLFIIEQRMEQLTVNMEQEHQRANELQSQYNTMQQQNIDNNNYIQNLKSDVEKLNCELTASQANLKSTTDKMLQDEKEIQMRLNTELERSKQFGIQIAELERDLETQSQTHKQKHEQLEQDLLAVKSSKLQVQEELQTKVNDFQKQLKELQQDLENSRKNCQKFEQIILDQKLSIIREKEIQMEQEAKAIAEITNKYRSEQMLLQQQLDLARQELENQKMEQTQVEKELSTAKIKQAQLENEIHVNNIKITEYEMKHERELKQQSDIQRQQLKESEKKITDLQQQLKEGLKKLKLRDEQLLDDHKLLDDQRNKCERLEIQLQEQEEDLKQKSDEQKQQLEESEKKITDLQQQLTEGLKKLKLRDEQLLHDRKLLDDQRNICERLETKLKKQEEDLMQNSDDQKKQLLESEKKITDLQNQLTEGMKKLEQRDEQLLQDRKLLDVERKKCEHLEYELKKHEDLKHKSDEQKQQLEESEKKIADLQQQLAEGLKKLKLRDEQLLDDRKLLDDQRNKCERLEIQLKKQEEDLKQKSDEQKQQLEESEKKIADLQQQSKEARDKLAQHDEQLLDDRKLLDYERNKCERLETQLKKQEDDLKHKSEDQRQQLEEAEKKIADLQQQLTERLKKLEQRDEQLLHDRKLLDVEQKKCEHLECELKKHEDLKQKSDEQKQQLEESEEKISDLQQQLKEARDKLAHYDEQLLDDRKLLDDERNKCERLETQLKKQEEDLKQNSDDQKNQILESEKKITDIQLQLTEGMKKLEQRDEQLLHDRKLLNVEQKKCEHLECELKKHEDLKQKSDEQKQQLEESEEKISDLQQQLKEARDKLAHHDEQLLNDCKLLDDERNKCERLETQLKKQEGDLKQKSEDQRRQLEESEKKITDLQQQLTERLKKLEQRDEQLLDDRKLLDVERKKCERLENQIKHLEAKHFVGEKDIKDTLAKKEEELEKIKTQLDLTTKRLEKMAVKLGEHQAVLSKKQREINQAKVGQDEQWDLLRTLQHEKESLQVELRQNKERVKRAEDKLINLEHQRCSDEAERVAKHDRMIELEKTCENLEMKRIELEQQLKITEQEKLRLSQEAEHRTNGIESASKQKDEEVKLCLKDVGVNTSDTLCAKPKVDCSAQTSFEKDNNPFSSQIDANTQNKLRVVELQLSEAMKELDHTRQAHKNVQNELDAGLAEIRISRETLQKTREQMTQENAKRQQLELDCQILQAKYRDSKDEIGRFEQKLKDQRLEMEGKLDKMKTKMRTLYMAEVTRMKEKQESDTAGVKAELEKVTAQNAKYEEHTRKLSNQIVRLNEKILDQQKQEALLSTKLRHLQEAQQAASEEWQPFKRPSAPSANLGSNLTMEDEEGEVFNNTYLTDLKTGRVPNITTEELQYRNSLQPPHLKSTYAAQYDVGVQEDDLKDCQLSLDDSMSALLTGNGGGANARKKSIGTHYKRPGPPTPSKNGGRMSFGSSEPPREVLRETYENGTAKTPARFKMFASRFSMGSSSTSGTGGGSGVGGGGGGGGGNFLPRDEQPQHRQLWTVQSRKLHLASGSDGRFCTSTPRNVKRQLNYDRQRLILHDDANSASEHHQNANGTPHLSNAELLASTNRRRRRLVSTSSADSSSAASIQSNNVASQDKCMEKPRVTFCLHGNIFAKGRSRIKPSLTKATVAYRRLELQRKIREKRFGRFDQERQLELYDKADDSQEENTMSTLSEHNDNDNNANCIAEHNRNYSVVDVTCLFANLFLDDMDETEMVSEVEPKMESQTESETQSEIESETQFMLLPRTLPNAAITFNVETSTTNNSYWRWSPELRLHKRFWSRILLALVVLIAIGLRFLIDFN